MIQRFLGLGLTPSVLHWDERRYNETEDRVNCRVSGELKLASICDRVNLQLKHCSQ
ncbi:MAG: hypothetical protein SWJ54_11710 [Cyanobacteriota bacterium]|nr:hypothetical protein [Cyanobacteriota bacterium]